MGLIPFFTVGYPDLATTVTLVSQAVAGGADLVELGVPFSDPLADGATIQRSSFHALRQGVNLQNCLDVCRQLRDDSVSVPLLLMGYYNPFLNYGLEALCREAAAAGVDGFIVADLPPEEGDGLRDACLGRGLDLVFLVSPTSPDERIAMIGQKARGFLYCVSLRGVTGARRELPADLPLFLSRVRRFTQLPLAVGFGISTKAHVQALAGHADAAIVGSALVDVIQGEEPAQMPDRVREYIRRLTSEDD